MTPLAWAQRALPWCLTLGLSSLPAFAAPSEGAAASASSSEADADVKADARIAACEPKVQSNFWASLSGLCGRLDEVEVEKAPDDVRPSLEEAAAFCRDETKEPTFARASESERLDVLRRIAAWTGLPSLPNAPESSSGDGQGNGGSPSLDWDGDTGGELPGGKVSGPQGKRRGKAKLRGELTLTASAESFSSSGDLQMGIGAGFLVSDVVGRVCGASDASHWLPHTCGPHSAENALISLRNALFFDVASMPRLALEGSDTEIDAGTELGLRVLEGLAGGLDVAGTLRTLTVSRAELQAATAACVAAAARFDASLPEWKANVAALQKAQLSGKAELILPAWKAVLEGAVQPPSFHWVKPDVRSVRLAAEIALRVLGDEFELGRSELHYRGLILGALIDAGMLEMGAALDAELEASIELAAKQLVALNLAVRAAASGELGQLELLDAFFAAYEAIAVVAEAPPIPGILVQLTRALVGGRLSAAATLAIEFAGLQGARAAVKFTAPSPELAADIEFGIRFLLARDDQMRLALLKGAILGPWAEPFLFDANIGAIAVEGDDYRLAGDGLLGFNSGSWGIIGSGFASSYDLSTDVSFDQTDRFGGDLEGWFVGNADGALRWELRATFGGALYDTNSFNPELVTFRDETSLLLGGTLLGGIRLHQPTFALGLWLGGGGQFESYNSLDAISSQAIADQDTLGTRYEARFRAAWHVIPSWLALRARINAELFGLTRQTDTISFGQGVTVDSELVTSTQLLVDARAYVDLEALHLAGFVPGLAIGGDYVDRNDGAFNPVVQVSIRAEVF